jgi:PadR family transcriptional regulator PadR
MNSQFKKGVLDYCVLSLIKQKNCYGYEIVSELAKHMAISEGTIYPLLRRLKNDAFVTTYLQESSDGPPRKYYQLTELGEKTQLQFEQEWSDFKQSVDTICSNKKGSNHD